MQVTFVEAMPNIMPGFDREIAKLAQRLLINTRPIDFHTNVIASKVTPGARVGGRAQCSSRPVSVVGPLPSHLAQRQTSRTVTPYPCMHAM